MGTLISLAKKAMQLETIKDTYEYQTLFEKSGFYSEVIPGIKFDIDIYNEKGVDAIFVRAIYEGCSYFSNSKSYVVIVIELTRNLRDSVNWVVNPCPRILGCNSSYSDEPVEITGDLKIDFNTCLLVAISELERILKISN